MILTSFCSFLVFAPLAVYSQYIRDPCGGYPCRDNRQECRMVQPNFCFQPPCRPQPRCVAKLLRVSSCRYGDPVLDTNNRPLTCYPGRSCPVTTTCNTEVMDTQATCCWTPQTGPPIQPPPTPFNPCISTLCLLGQVCEVQQPNTCFRRPCQSVGVCVAKPINPPLPPSPPTTTAPPCQTTRCNPGYHCKEVLAPCVPPGACPKKAVCVKNVPVTPSPANGCPVMTGKLVCDINCELDADCDPGFRCCKHSCGNACVKPGSHTTTTTPTKPLGHPCDNVTCTAGYECRLRQVQCFAAPCNPVASCGPAITPKPMEPQCLVGLPVVDSNNKELFCGRGPGRQDCPVNTYCNVHPTDKFAVCCHKQNTAPAPPTVAPVNPCDGVFCPLGQECRVETIVCVTTPCPGPRPVCREKNKQGTCPTSPPGFGACVAKCTNDADCSGNFKCCGNCPRQCTAPAPPLPTQPNEKPGRCPPPSGLAGICIARCSTDTQCPGNQKCCGGCPRQCTDPISTPPIPPTPVSPVQNPCTLILCGSNTICVEKPTQCFNPPCPKRGECVPVTKPPPPPTTPTSGGKPGMCRPPSGYGYCANMCSGDASCPGTQKCCGNGCGFACQEPMTEKLGFCPLNSQTGNATACVAQCNGDFSCPWDQKCCTQGCRSSCVAPLRSAPFVDSDPCKRQVCHPTQVCKLQQVYCIRPPCKPMAICVAKTPMDDTSICGSGYPVLNWSQRPISCGQFNQRCPDNTVCSNGSCCWNTDVAVKPMTPTGCPGVHDVSLWFFCNFYPTCTTDADCSPDQKCCHASGCGKRCMTLRSK